MSDKVYYGERNNYINEVKIDFDALLRLFRNSIDLLINDSYFLEATGYYCTDKGRILGRWGIDVEIFIYEKTSYEYLWPVDDYYENYTEDMLFTMIEFLFDYVSEPVNRWYHEWNNCGWHCDKYNKELGQEKYRKVMNEILMRYKQGYILSEDGQVQRIADTGFENLVYQRVDTDDKENIDNRVNNAVDKFLHYNSNIDDKKGALLVLFGVLEYLKTCNIKLEGKDSSDLFNIMNGLIYDTIKKFNKENIKKMNGMSGCFILVCHQLNYY
ncbi:hypothetical protein [Clostridium butyricum]